MVTGTGKFIVSLDFELMWGVRDVANIDTYGENIRGVHSALPGILSRFAQYGIRGTFAAVGFLFFENKQELLRHIPAKKPTYTDANLSPYGDYIANEVGADCNTDPYHFGAHLIELIRNTPGQEVGTHTFSHFYCLEPGQTVEAFTADLAAAIAVGKLRGVEIRSIIFPRNQVNETYLNECAKAGIIAYRSNERSWVYSARSSENESLFRRSLRLADAYLNITGHHTYPNQLQNTGAPVDIPSSRFLRPWSKRLSFFENIRLRRIRRSMTYAARHNRIYHLWWHPHNFGIHQEKNFAFLEKILQHYQHLQKKYNFSSVNMSELAREWTSAAK